MRKAIAVAIILFMMVAHGGSKPSAQVRQSNSSLSPAERGRMKRFERQLEELRLRLKIPGMSAAIVKNQQLIWAKGFGFSDYENRVAATAETPYELASVTKPIAATLLMQLVEQGRVSLDDPMSKYSSNYTGDSIRVRHV